MASHAKQSAGFKSQQMCWIYIRAIYRKREISASLTKLNKAFDCVDHSEAWKILQEMGIPDHLTCLLRNLYAGQEATVRTGHRMTDWFKIGKTA